MHGRHLSSRVGRSFVLRVLGVDDIDELYASVTSQGTTVVKDIRNEAWGMREFGIRTVDGHRIMVGSGMSADG